MSQTTEIDKMHPGGVPSTTSDKIKRSRRRRFRRDPEFRSEKSRAGKFRPNERDANIVFEVAKHRFMDTRQACALFGCDCPKVKEKRERGKEKEVIVEVWKKQHVAGCSCSCDVGEHRKGKHAETCKSLFKDELHIASRLRELFQHGELERPIIQLQLRVKEGVQEMGSVPMVYAVTRSGLNMIGEKRRRELGGLGMWWSLKANASTRVFMEHTLAVTDVSVAVSRSVRNVEDLERIADTTLRENFTEEWQERERKALATKTQAPRPFGMSAHLGKEDVTVHSDLVFSIGNKVTRKRWNFFVEVDMGTMPVVRGSADKPDLTKSSILRKAVAYAAAHENGQHKQYGLKTFRVLVLTTSPERVLSCAKAVKARFGSGKAGKLFLFGLLPSAVEAAAKVNYDLLQHDFIDSEGVVVRLMG